MTDTDELVARIRANIATDRAVAEACDAPLGWRVGNHQRRTLYSIYGTAWESRDAIIGLLDVDDYATHAARQDPAATLARCDALTALVDLHKPEHFSGGPPRGDDMDVCTLCGEITVTGDIEGEWPCESLRTIAAIWPAP